MNGIDVDGFRAMRAPNGGWIVLDYGHDPQGLRIPIASFSDTVDFLSWLHKELNIKPVMPAQE